MSIDLIDYGNGVYALDSGFLGTRMDAIHLIVEGERAAVVDTGNYESVPKILDALDSLGIARDKVDYVILTHVHLDHAGGAGLLMRSLSAASLVVHPRGARHMIDPSMLWAGTVAVYGQDKAQQDYGELIPVPAERVIEASDGDSLTLGSRKIEFFDSPGHAKHHLFVHDTRARAIFSGDTFGLSYRQLDQGDRKFIFPTTTPTQFDPDALKASIDHMLSLKPDAIYLTHYSEIREVEPMGADLKRLVDAHAEVGLRCEPLTGEAREQALLQGVRKIADDEAHRQGADPAVWAQMLDNDIRLNAQGLAAWLDFRRRKT